MIYKTVFSVAQNPYIPDIVSWRPLAVTVELTPAMESEKNYVFGIPVEICAKITGKHLTKIDPFAGVSFVFCEATPLPVCVINETFYS